MNTPVAPATQNRAPAPPLLQGKVVLVCGVGPDLGRALAVRSAQAGSDIVLAARSADRLNLIEQEIRDLGRQALAVPTDITNASARHELARAAMDSFGHVDVLMNAAFAHPPYVKLLEADLDEMRQQTALNVLASVGLVQELADTLTARRGSVVLINSLVLRNRLPGVGSYRMDKAALLAAARSLSIELGPRGVRVNSVAPGYIWGDKLRDFYAWREANGGATAAEKYAEKAQQTDLLRLPTPDEIADAAVFLASDFASGITGQCLDVTCGQSHH